MRRPRSAVSGLTLTEVLVALFILGSTLLAGMLAQRRYLSQLGDLADQETAAEYARGALAEMLAVRDIRETVERGQVPGRPEWAWSRSVRQETAFSDRGLYRLEVQVLREGPGGEETCMARLATMRYSDQKPAAVESR